MAALRVDDGAEVTLVTEHGELTLRCKATDRPAEGAAFVPYYYGGGAVCALLPPSGAPTPVQVKVRALA